MIFCQRSFFLGYNRLILWSNSLNWLIPPGTIQNAPLACLNSSTNSSWSDCDIIIRLWWIHCPYIDKLFCTRGLMFGDRKFTASCAGFDRAKCLAASSAISCRTNGLTTAFRADTQKRWRYEVPSRADNEHSQRISSLQGGFREYFTVGRSSGVLRARDSSASIPTRYALLR